MSDNCAVILAAGEGKRMRSNKPKVMLELMFRPMLDWVLDAVTDAGVENVCVVTGHLHEQVEEHLDGRFVTAYQDANGYGTGYAVMKAADFINKFKGGNVLVLCGDAPLIDADTITGALRRHIETGAAATVITAELPDPTGYGRIIRADNGRLSAIVEQADATEAQLAVREVNSGGYWFSVDKLAKVLFNITNSNPKGEYYLTDTVDMLARAGEVLEAYTAKGTDVVLGANDRLQLSEMNELVRNRVLDSLMRSGVDIPCRDGVIIHPKAVIGADTQILPGTIIKENVVIGTGCSIGPNTLVQNSKIGDNVKLNNVQCYDSVVENGVKAGPFIHIRPNSHLMEEVYLGDFVEVKNSTVGRGTHVSHLTYIGDSDVGEKVNFGCGTVTVNYNGESKARCTIGDHAFIGCNTNLVAPVTVGDFGYTAAGSTITDDVPEQTLAIARARQVNKEGWVKDNIKFKK